MTSAEEQLIRAIIRFVHEDSFRDGGTGPFSGLSTVMVVDTQSLLDCIVEHMRMEPEIMSRWVDEEWEYVNE